MRTFFCDPHAPWQKGGVENAIGRMRRGLPRKTDLATLSHQPLLCLLRAYNHTPRKCLNYKTPAEVFTRDLLHFKCESTSRFLTRRSPRRWTIGVGSVTRNGGPRTASSWPTKGKAAISSRRTLTRTSGSALSFGLITPRTVASFFAFQIPKPLAPGPATRRIFTTSAQIRSTAPARSPILRRYLRRRTPAGDGTFTRSLPKARS